MATTQQHAPPSKDESTATASDSADVFTEYIRENPGVCDTCFRRVKDYTHPPTDRWFDQHTRSSATLKTVVTSMTTPGKDGVYCHPPPKNHDTDDYRNRPAYGRIVCNACGHIDPPYGRFAASLRDPDADDHAGLPKSTLKRATDRCVSRLREAGVSVHDHATFSAVDTLKSKPRYAARDADIIRAALTIGVRRADEPQPQHQPDDLPPREHASD